MATTNEASSTATATSPSPSSIVLPRVAITFCTQCRWMLRAAYFAQELLSTFGTVIGEVALIPATGGIFTVDLTYQPPVKNEGEASAEADAEAKATAGDRAPNTSGEVKTVRLWEFKTVKAFPETKVLKQLVRDHLQPERSLGHSDKGGARERVVKTIEEASKTQGKDETSTATPTPKMEEKGEVCEDCQ